jgi:CheY-like chemotaxis protein
LSTNPLSALNGQEALDLITNKDSDNSEYLVLLDINMPVMDGWQFLESLGNLNNPPKVNVVIVTSSIDTIDKRKATKYPQVIGFFEKPLTQENCIQIKQFEALKHYFS